MVALLPDLGNSSGHIASSSLSTWGAVHSAVACSCLSAVVHGNPLSKLDQHSKQCMQVITHMCHVPELMMHMMKHDMTSRILLFIATATCNGSCMHAFLLSSTG